MYYLEISRTIEELKNPLLGINHSFKIFINHSKIPVSLMPSSLGGGIVLENENRSFDTIVGLFDVEGIRVVDDDGAYVGRTDDDGEKVVVESQKICSCLDHRTSPPSNMRILFICSS